ncbi:MAG: signal peptidase I [Paludibacteraceae bacterium]|jgi:signal peptidase I, bacterial type|nr:signal peptidase I [Paludibacteraceae bacterium]
MKSFNERIQEVTRGGWTRAGIWCTLYIAFVIWVAWNDWFSLLWLLLLPLIADAFTTKYINWSWWRKYKPADKGEPENPQANSLLYTICSWIDAIVFALVAVYFINIYIFQNYQIPSSSLEKTLRVGDFLYVSKMGYGARVPQTPLSMPLVQHTFPEWLGGGKSYFDHPQWEYKRLAGWKTPQKGDIVVFNFPAGDTVCTKYQNPDYYTLCYYQGRSVVNNRKDIFGDIVVRPVDRRENYVKRCVGTPGDSLQIIDNVIFINGEQEPTHEYAQLNYFVRTDGHVFTKSYLDKLGISKDDRMLVESGLYHFPLTKQMKEQLAKNPHVIGIEVEPAQYGGAVYPLGHNDWTRDNYGPIYIPRKGDRLMITEQNYWIYKRIADAYEFKPIRIGEEYIFDMDYYWMMGDNRHNSADSRYWGFVPEDHIVGQPIFVWLSIEKDHPWGKGHIRWNRLGLRAE